MSHIDAEPAFILHLRPYRDTSALIDVLSHRQGKVSCVVKGLRGSSKSRQVWRAGLQPFNLLLLSWRGRTELKTLSDVQPQRQYRLAGQVQFYGLYLNELTQRLLHDHVPHPDIFEHYVHSLADLSQSGMSEAVLRRYEFALLRALGYGVEPGYCADDGSAVDPRGRYRFVPEYGMQRVAEGERGFDGEVLMQIAAGQFEGDALRVAKRLTRSALAPLLGDRPLRSRELFVAATGGGERGELTK